ncbi:MAG: DEAD/DEAH box helicase [Candidatus Marinimicrobia bacterium]|nr:DEAD/DEAH box helicase [Candidatus Neomarinimicrobiota bacterium]MCF7850036.1 DEAD/DEAH box helicase [Candidatus Neomarinimicrobiota bacterium]
MPELQRAITREGYSTPTPIQEQAIPRLLEGRDLIGTAQTGTGKTAAFALPILQHLSKHPKKPQKGAPRCLVLSPTRELAAQIGASFTRYGKYLKISNTTIFGGVNQHSQVQALRASVDIVVATPGRLLDLMRQGHLRLDAVDIFVLDEVDRMLDMGFLPDIKHVLKSLSPKRQTLFFSATMPPKLRILASTMVNDPIQVSIEPDKPAVDRITQKVMFVGKKNKNALLLSLMNEHNINKAIVFTQMKHVANRVAKQLQNAGFKGEAIHGNKSQATRTRTLNGFKRGHFQVLVATDVAARGLDVDDITHVINYDLPVEAETYVHRIGRTGRAGADGDAISFCSTEERSYLRDIERLLGNPVTADLEHAFHSPEALQTTSGSKAVNHSNGSGNRKRRNSRNFNRSRR